MLPQLNTERLLLRALVEDDAAMIAVLAGEWEVASKTGRIPHPYSVAMALDFIAAQREAAKQGIEYVFAVTRQSDGQLMGCVGTSFDGDQAELGYWFGQAYWGLGYASEAARAVLDFIVSTSDIALLTSSHLPENLASGRVLAKLGFNCIGQSPVVWRDGEQVDLVQYQLLATQWAQAQAR